jgi:hypothetical protein
MEPMYESFGSKVFSVTRTAKKFLRPLVIVAASLLLANGVATAAGPTPPFIPPDADWLTTVNYYRAMSGLTPVAGDAGLSAGAYNHSCYMLQNGISHDELPGSPGYTVDGDAAGNNGNVAVSSVFNTTARSHIELWMTGPFHAIGVLRPNLLTSGFGKCDNPATSPWRSGGTLDVLHGLGPSVPQTAPILFPGNGTTTNLDRFIVETPDPLGFCGWTGSAGLPVIAMMPEDIVVHPTASITGPSGPLQTCVLSELNTTSTASAILAGNNAVVVIPRAPLAPGTYTVSVVTTSRTVNWSFTVDPAAAVGTIPPIDNTTPIGTSTAFQPISPDRLVDTRINKGSTRLTGSLTRRIQITGSGIVPADAKAISANFTIVGAQGGGYLTVWNCSDSRPVVSTLNFAGGDVVPNGASVPLDSAGGICVYASSSADLIIDVNGYYAANGTGFFTPVAPERLFDSRVQLRSRGRFANGETQSLRITQLAGVPSNASAVALNVTSVSPSLQGFVTVYPCNIARPFVSSLNPVPGAVRPNMVLVPVAPDGTICFFSSTAVDLIADVTGYISTTQTTKFTPTSPFRLTDTRDRYHPEVNGGKNGETLKAGEILTIQVAGTRGIAAGAKAITANLTVVGGSGTGYLTVWPCGPQPSTSNVNFEAQAAIANGAQLPLSASGQLCFFSSADVHVIMDVAGWWS